MAKKAKEKKPKDLTPRFGIGEWFGKVLTRLDSAERRYYALEVLKEKKLREAQPCPFKASKQDAKCTKEGGVCSLRLYSYKAEEKTGRAAGEPVAGPQILAETGDVMAPPHPSQLSLTTLERDVVLHSAGVSPVTGMAGRGGGM